MARARVALCSMWRNDADRNLAARARHLLRKAADRVIWIVGDSDDETFEVLSELAEQEPRVRLIEMRTGIEGTEFGCRLRRLSLTANQWFALADGPDGFPDYLIVHESDLVSPADVVERLLAHAAVGRHCVAGWPVIRLGAQEQFYDIWAYRAGGVHFSAWPPYHAVYRPDAPFEVDSFGSVYMLPGEAARRIEMGAEAVVDLCRQLREQGHRLWVDPTLTVEQPVELWEPWPAR